MVQVLPYVQSPLEQLTPHLAQFGANIGEGLARRAVSKQDEAAYKQFETAKTPMEQVNAYLKFSPETQKAIGPVISSLIKNKQEGESSSQNIQGSFENLVGLLGSENIGVRTNLAQFFGDKALSEQAEFENSKINLIAELRDRVNKGVLSNQKFNYLIERLPKFNERKASIRGKLLGVGKELGLDISSLGGEEKDGESEIKIGQEFEKLPPAEGVPNGIIRSGNKRYKSDGKTWKQI